jgi:hypothetical protein
MDYSAPQPLATQEVTLERAVDGHGLDVSAELSTVDGRYYVSERGDAAELSFRIPPLPQGMARSWVLQSTGWYRMHTDQSGAPQTAVLDRVMLDPLAAARIAVARAAALVTASAESSR